MNMARSPKQYLGVRAILPPDLQTALRAPTSSDRAYVKGTLWLDTANSTSYMWPGSGNWIALGSGTTGAIITLTGDSGGAISPIAGNIDILGGPGVTVVGTAGTLTISLTGGGVAIDSFVPGAGTNPVVPSALGVVTMAGTANQITTTGGLNTLTFSIPSAFIAPGSIASTTTITSGTSLSVTTSAVIGTTLTATGGLTTLAALTQVGTTLINASGAAVTTIGTGGTGAVNIGNATGNTAVTGSLTASTTLTATLGAITATNGNLVLGTAGNKILSTSVATTTTAGANSFGSVTLSGGTATVSTTAVTANSLIVIWRQTVGATGAAALGHLCHSTIVAATSFVINANLTADATALATTDVSVVGWMIIN